MDVFPPTGAPHNGDVSLASIQSTWNIGSATLSVEDFMARGSYSTRETWTSLLENPPQCSIRLADDGVYEVDMPAPGSESTRITLLYEYARLLGGGVRYMAKAKTAITKESRLWKEGYERGLKDLSEEAQSTQQLPMGERVSTESRHVRTFIRHAANVRSRHEMTQRRGRRKHVKPGLRGQLSTATQWSQYDTI
jgi:hypothetical protein